MMQRKRGKMKERQMEKGDRSVNLDLLHGLSFINNTFCLTLCLNRNYNSEMQYLSTEETPIGTKVCK